MKKSAGTRPKIITKGSVVLYFSDGEGFSKPANYRGYHLSYQETTTDGTGRGISQRILPGISEQSEENDKQAQSYFSEIEDEISHTFDNLFKRDFGNRKKE